jgi:hypothetical protein
MSPDTEHSVIVVEVDGSNKSKRRRPLPVALREMAATRVEILYFDGCPNQSGAVDLVERVAAELGQELEVRLVEVPAPEAAIQQRFLGSPTIRVDGRDIEPGAEARTEYVYGCRIYRTGSGITGQPDERWLRDALTAASTDTSG